MAEKCRVSGVARGLSHIRRMKRLPYFSILALFAMVSKSFATNSLEQQQEQDYSLSEMVQ